MRVLFREEPFPCEIANFEDVCITGREVSAGDLHVDERLMSRLVLGVREAQRVRLPVRLSWM